MNRILGFLLTAVLAVAVCAQSKPALSSDSSRFEKYQEMSGKKESMREMPMGGMQNMGCEIGSPMASHWGKNMIRLHFRAAMAAMGMVLFTCFLLYAALNVLLTVFVVMDMIRLKHFYGLLIPVVVIAGIPGTIIYALFRISDSLKSAGDNK